MNFKPLASFDNYMLANMTLGPAGERHNCPSKDEHIVTVVPTQNPAVGSIKIWVEESGLKKRRALAETGRSELR